MTPSELIWWALAIGLAWMILIALTDLDVWLKRIVGRKGRDSDLAARVKALEERVTQLEHKR